MSRVREALRIAPAAAAVGFAEFRSYYTVSSWAFGWCTRLVLQVIFFSMTGLLVGGRHSIEYLLIGNVVAVAALEATTVIVSMTRERWYGTLSLVVASPAPVAVVLLVSNINWPLTAMLSAGVSLAVSAAVFGLSLSATAVVTGFMVIFVCAASAFAFGAVIGVVVMRFPSLDFTAMNVSYLSLMAFTGVNVPVEFWPDVVRRVVQILPVTHGLRAVRSVFAGQPPSGVLGDVALELLVGSGWLIVAVLLINRFISHGRRAAVFDLG
jgi:ABC-2 type transport system permease protein